MALISSCTVAFEIASLSTRPSFAAGLAAGFCPAFTDTELRLIMGQEGCHGNTTEKFGRVQTRSGGHARRTRGDGEPNRCLRVSASGYDGWTTRLLARRRGLHTQHDGVSGRPRMWEELRYAGERCGRHRVARLMRHAGWHGGPQRRPWRRKASGLPPAGTQNHLERDVTAPPPIPNGSRTSRTSARRSTGYISASCWICIPA
jgi:hypothetical protein